MWQVSVGGQPWGTFSEAQITQMIQAGQLRDGWIAQVGTNQWMALQQHPGFAAALRGGHAGQLATGHLAPGHLAPGHHAPGHLAPGRPPQPKSNVALVVGLVVGLLVLASIGGVVLLAVVAGDDDEPPRASAPAAPTAPARTLDGVVAPRKAAIEAKLATVLRIAASLPPATTREVVTVDRGPLVLVVGSSASIGKGEALTRTGTATIVQLEDLQGQLATRRDLTYSSGEALLHDCAAIARNLPTPSSFSPSSDLTATEAVLDQCVKLRHLLVIRTPKSIEPVVDQANSRYTPGIAEGDVLVFDIDSGKHLGGFRFAARNDPQMELSIADPRRDLVRDVNKKVWSAISAGLQRTAPGATIVNLY